MAFQQKYVITPRYLSKPSKRRSGLFISPAVKFIVAHDTGNPRATANANVSYYERSRDDESASAHIFVDDKQILECIPALTAQPEKAWHVLYRVDTDNRMFGHNANDAAIGVEYCYGDNIDADEAYRKYVWTIAYICHTFDLDPANSVVGHAFLDPTRKTDPGTGLGYSRRSYEQLLRDIPNEYQACTVADEAGGAATVAPASALINETGTVKVVAKLNVRKGKPSRMADAAQVVVPGTQLSYVGYVTDGEAVNGNPKWYADASGNYFWSGATVP
jgi:N-acetyl-anhydromuramyl-L-alanine amidase AmpD